MFPDVGLTRPALTAPLLINDFDSNDESVRVHPDLRQTRLSVDGWTYPGQVAMNDLYTIGHSTHTIDRFIELLHAHSITAVADVRSTPFSRFTPQFNQNTLDAALRKEGISYVFVGRELGARAEDSACYRDGKVQFGLLAKTALFREGLDRIRKGVLVKRIALLCTEKDPITCHRTILVCRHLRADMRYILHILEDGSTEDNVRSERRLMQTLGITGNDLFASDEELIERAYDQQGETIAYTKPADGSAGDE